MPLLLLYEWHKKQNAINKGIKISPPPSCATHCLPPQPNSVVYGQVVLPSTTSSLEKYQACSCSPGAMLTEIHIFKHTYKQWWLPCALLVSIQTTTTVSWPLYRTTCISRHPQRWRILTEQIFTACMPFLMVTSALGLGSRRYSSLQWC